MRTGKLPKNIDEFIAQYPEDVQEKLQKLRATILKAAPGAEEAIKYGIAMFVLKGNLVAFSAYKNHIGWYPGAAPLVAFKKELKGYETSKGTVQFPIDKPIPMTLIKEMTKFRVIENEEKAKKKAVKKVKK